MISMETIMNCILHADHNCESFKMETTMSIETVPFTCNGTQWFFLFSFLMLSIIQQSPSVVLTMDS